MGNIFDILGPVMVGPSSSHTAGAVRIGMVGIRPSAGEGGGYLAWLVCRNRKGTWNGQGIDCRFIGDDAG